jgi:hypothetical protein
MKDGLVGEVTLWRIMEAYAVPLLYGGLVLAALDVRFVIRLPVSAALDKPRGL